MLKKTAITVNFARSEASLGQSEAEWARVGGCDATVAGPQDNEIVMAGWALGRGCHGDQLS
jgi:Mrp family chromosome partitioning ATPase